MPVQLLLLEHFARCVINGSAEICEDVQCRSERFVSSEKCVNPPSSGEVHAGVLVISLM